MERTALLQNYGEIRDENEILNGRVQAGEDLENAGVGIGGGGGESGGENPLFEGNEEMKKRMVWLFPAVSVGVSLHLSFLLLPKTVVWIRRKQRLGRGELWLESMYVRED